MDIYIHIYGKRITWRKYPACVLSCRYNMDPALMQVEKVFVSNVNPFMPTGAFNICCPRDCVSRHNGGTSGAPLKPLRVDSALRALRI